MAWEAWFTLALVLSLIVALARNWAAPDTLFLAGLTILMTVGSISGSAKLPSTQALVAGFGNEGLITVAVLFVLAQGLTQTGAMSMITEPLLGRPKSIAGAQARLLLPAAGLSAFLNNTTIVAIFIPVVTDWCKKAGLAASKLFIPLSYAAILGGICTLIGTSTNLVVFGMTRAAVKSGEIAPVEIGMFTVAIVGVPVAIVGLLYIFIATSKLLPDRRAKRADETEARQYTVEMLVEPKSPVDGKTIEQAGLRNLQGLFLAEIERDGDRIVAAGPQTVLRGNDRLIFVGVVDSVVDLQRIRGLQPATNQVFKLQDPRHNRCLVEAVISTQHPMIGKSIREGRFRSQYNAAVIAVHRGGVHLKDQKIGDIVLQAGDTLLIETHPRFVENYRNSHDFFLVSAVEGSQPMRHDRAWIALAILAGVVACVTPGWLSMLNGALLGAGLMVLTRCCSANDARKSIDWRLLLMIGAAFGVGEALKTSGLASTMAQGLVDAAGGRPWLVMLAIYAVTLFFTELVTNNAAAVLVFPVALMASKSIGADFTGFAVLIMIAASCGFATPFGYQTHLMVYNAGSYRFTDYLRFGLPLDLLVMATAVVGVNLVWPVTAVG
ncbi:MAG: SLC13 family permease [Phycisphaeraceae bacterium]